MCLFYLALHGLVLNYTPLDIARETRWDILVLMIDTCIWLNISPVTPNSPRLGSNMCVFCRVVHWLLINYLRLESARASTRGTIVFKIDTCSCWIFSIITPNKQVLKSDLGLFYCSAHALVLNSTPLDRARETKWDTLVLMIDTCSLLNTPLYYSQQPLIWVRYVLFLLCSSLIGIELNTMG
jgi:hypothetical protein